MQFRCIEYHRIESGAFWQEGETYEFTRQDLLALPDVNDFLSHFEPVNGAAKDYVASLEVAS